jgi:hypothetical protein
LRVHHATEKGFQLKTHELIVSEAFCLTVDNCTQGCKTVHVGSFRSPGDPMEEGLRGTTAIPSPDGETEAQGGYASLVGPHS